MDAPHQPLRAAAADLPALRRGTGADRAAPASPAPGKASYVEPDGPVQRTLADIWSDVLGIDRVGARDNFFDLGGDSILTIQVVSRARQAGLRLSAKDVFLHQSVAELAAAATVVHDDGNGTAPVVGRWH